ncbi:MAG TPA: TIGR01777 family oxidoreductase [Terracidiphilus sp.]|jgi:hypothetical protein|nr:TIGR01777 family oxidoreductase [Terracidiphilus sp.]
MQPGSTGRAYLTGDKILLSGASGMLGTAIRHSLSESGAELVQLVRRAPAAPGEVQWNPLDETPLATPQALEGARAAIHLSGANVAARRWTAAYRREMTASRTGSTRALCRVLTGLSHPPQVLLVASAVGIYGNRGEEVLDEDSAPGTGFLADLCRAWEKTARPAAAAGMRVVNLRFGMVLGPGGALGKMLPLFRMGLGGKMGNGRQWMSWVGIEDVVAAVRFLLETPSLEGAVNVTAPHPVRNAEFTRALSARLHRPALLPVPAFALRVAVGKMADEALLTSARAMPKRLLEAGFRFTQPNVEDALAAAIQ